MKHSKLTLKWKMFIILAAFILVVLGVIWIFEFVLLDDIYRAAKRNELKENAETITANIDNENLDTLVDRISYYEDISIRIINNDGVILYQADAKFSTIARLSEASLLGKFNNAKSKNGMYTETFPYENFMEDEYEDYPFEGKVPGDDSDNAESLILIKVIYNGDGEELGLIMDSTLTPINATKQTMIIQLSIITVGVLVLTMAIIYILSRSIANPILSLNKSAKELAKGKYDIKFYGGGYKEIDELRDTLNYASKEISNIDHLRRELISNVSHDLRTPLTLIKGYSEMMRDIPSESTPENIQTIIDETERLTDLVNSMLELTRLQEGGDKLNLKRYDIVKSVQDIIDRYSRFLKAQGYTIEYQHEESAFIIADEVKISQVIYNLLSNAVNYAGEDKMIIIRQLIKGNNVRVEVIDHGEGIDVDILPHIWDRYFKSEKAHKRATVGTGLGLSIVKSVISSHPGGVYGVESSVGNGSKFYFELPSA